jgi:alpha-ketoglutarate-dependent taurine dioxygenase
MSGTQDAAERMEAAVTEVRRALIAYPHFCVVELPDEVDDKATFVALAGAISGEYDPDQPSSGGNKRVSFTNVRIDAANASAPRKTGTRYSRTNLPMAPHTDSSFRGAPHELVAFHCVTHDEAGGESVLAAVEDVVRELDPTVIERLREPVFPFGKRLRPVLSGDPGREEIRYYRAQLDRPLEAGEAEISPEHRAAIDAVDVVLDRSDLFHQLHLRAGEILFMQNRKVLHGRSGFEGESNRHFRRIRLRARVLGDKVPG